MKKIQYQKSKVKSTHAPTVGGCANRTIRAETLQMTESMAYEMTLEMLAEEYNEGGYLGFIQAMFGFVRRYDDTVSEVERQGIDERMCRAIGATDIALTFIPAMRNELAKLEAR